MNFTCSECNDTGSRDKSGDYLDCGHCDAAMQRKSMNDFLDKLPAMGDYDAAWLVHQRALAMAPKQEALTFDADELPNDPLGCAGYLAGMAFGNCPSDEIGHCVSIITAALSAPAAANGAMPDFCFEDDTDFMHRLGLLMNTKWPEMRKDGLARKISELANAHIRAALSGAKGNS